MDPRMQAMLIATKNAGSGLPSGPVFTSLATAPSMDSARGRTMPLGPPPQRPVSFGRVSSFRTPSFVSQPSFQMGAAVPIQSSTSFNVSQAGSFQLGVSVQVQPKAAPTRSSRPAPSMHRSLSRGPPVESKATGQIPTVSRSSSHGPAPACRSRARFKFGDDDMPSPASEVIAPNSSRGNNALFQRPPSGRSSSKKGLFWTPPPEAVVVCEATRSPSFVAAKPTPRQAFAADSGGPTKARPPMAPVVSVVAARSHIPPIVDMQSMQPGGYTPSGYDWMAREGMAPPGPPRRMQSQPSFPPAHSFTMAFPPRVPSMSFMPSPRQLA